MPSVSHVFPSILLNTNILSTLYLTLLPSLSKTIVDENKTTLNK